MFSFGIVLWELLTGEEPYADLRYGAIIGKSLISIMIFTSIYFVMKKKSLGLLSI